MTGRNRTWVSCCGLIASRVFVTTRTTLNLIHLQIDALELRCCSLEVFENRKQERAVEGRETLMRSFESGF